MKISFDNHGHLERFEIIMSQWDIKGVIKVVESITYEDHFDGTEKSYVDAIISDKLSRRQLYEIGRAVELSRKSQITD